MIFDKIKLVKFVFLTWQNNVFKELQANLVKGGYLCMLKNYAKIRTEISRRS